VWSKYLTSHQCEEAGRQVQLSNLQQRNPAHLLCGARLLIHLRLLTHRTSRSVALQQTNLHHASHRLMSSHCFMIVVRSLNLDRQLEHLTLL
jgi:hypothetical protein